MSDRRLLLQAATTSQLVGRLVDASATTAGIPGYLLALLTHIRELGPVSPTAVARASGVPATTLRDNVQRLVDRGLVRRTPNPADGRSYLLVATPRGERTAQRAGDLLLDRYLALERELPRPLAEWQALLDELNAALHDVLDDATEHAAARGVEDDTAP